MPAVRMWSEVIPRECGWLMQVLGGYGYCDEYQVERLWRDAKLLEIGGGTLEAHHKNMVSCNRVLTPFS